jgi:hypothetical protein
MDQHEAWILMLDALESGHWQAVREQAEKLRIWIEMGGFPPDTSNGRFTDWYWNRQLALYYHGVK